MANQIINNSHKINTGAYQWKTNFSPAIREKAQEIIFSHKIKVKAHSQLNFDNNPVHESQLQII